MSLRLRIALLTCLTSLAAVGVTGALLIAESRSHAAAELQQKQLLFVQNRALALGYNLDLATRELTRLSQMAEVDLSDNDLRPEATLLAHAHRNSTLFNIGLQILDAGGRCLWSEPASADCPGRSFADRAWFREGMASVGPWVAGERGAEGAPTIINVLVPIGAQPRPSGMLRGILDLRNDRVVSPSLTSSLLPGTQAALVTKSGTLLYPGKLGPAWARALRAAPSAAASAFEEDDRADRYLYAHAPVTGTRWGLVFRWPYSALDDGQQRQARLLSLLLGMGGLGAVLLGLVTSRFLSRPINVLVAAVRRLGAARANGDAAEEPAAEEAVSRRSDELGELARAFSELRGKLQLGDDQHRHDLDRIRELAASLEARVMRRTAELEEAQRSLLAQERLAAMGQAAAVISHELKNSLGAIGMGVDLIASDARKSESLGRVHGQVRAEVTRLRTLTDELLVFARTPRINRRRVDLNALCRRAIELCAEQAESAQVNVRTALEPAGQPLWADCDEERLQSVLVNLVQNAIEAVAFRASPPVGASREVLVRTSPAAASGPPLVSIAVEDSGPGVPESARAHLYEPFFTTKRNGTGLGLATAQRFVAAHGGRIELQQGSLPGARFAVLLPAGEIAEGRAPPAPDGSSPAATTSAAAGTAGAAAGTAGAALGDNR